MNAARPLQQLHVYSGKVDFGSHSTLGGTVVAVIGYLALKDDFEV